MIIAPLFTLITTCAHFAHANGSTPETKTDDTPAGGAEVVSIGRRRLVGRGSVEVTLTADLVRLYRALGSAELPAYAIKFARTLTSPDDFARYELGLRYYVRPPGELGGGLSLEEAHPRTLELLHRRPSLREVQVEIDAFALIMKREIQILGTPPDQAVVNALTAAESYYADGDPPPVAKAPDEWRVRHQRATDGLARIYERAGLRPPTWVSSYVLALVEKYDAVESIDYEVEAYGIGLEFALAPTPGRGLGLNPKSAHEYALDLQRRRLHPGVVRMELETYEFAHQKYTAPVAEAGFGLDADEAGPRARAVAELFAVPFLHDAEELLERQRVLPAFFVKPIRNGGLGFAPAEAAAKVAEWDARFSFSVGVRDVIRTYEKILPRYLAKFLADGTYDEVRARQWALARIGDGNGMHEIAASLTGHGYPLVTLAELPPPPSANPVVRRGPVAAALACVRALIGRGPAK